MIEKIKDNKVILYGGIITLVLILFIILIFIISVLNKKYSYSDIESLMVKATKNYLNDNKELIPNSNGNEKIVDASILIDGKYLKSFDKLKKNANCDGTVTVIYNADGVRYKPYLKCNDYTTENILDKIKKDSPIVKEEQGLYKEDNYYVFKGEYINNYINFMDYKWRIVKFSDNFIELILADTLNAKTMYVYDDRYNDQVESQKGNNDFYNSRVYLTLKDFYNGYMNNKKLHPYLLNMAACTGKRSESETDKTGKVECSSTTNTYVSMLTTNEFMDASLDPQCNTILSRNCSNYNYLAKASNKWWLLNGDTENSSKVYGVHQAGYTVLEYANVKKDLRLVISIPTDSLYKSGNGTEKTPYEIYTY